MNPPQPMKEKVVTTSYEECRKNHAASIGKYAVDGCCEFMPAGEEGSAAALRCAACCCHRNFHKKVVRQVTSTIGLVQESQLMSNKVTQINAINIRLKWGCELARG
ncbi:hypothetical protein RD792_014219 [Penstemon davidsonii]|uniref:ZF-HD dimerization-type domain-containing protein n=1 Tax=Penstemon davidsonii TaxID=160366 RepID=A0ABR0CQD7_9LAMI|nr:hypothetical protein RD792_014219 [Penstemon davidsonii]